jgi:hypothetical protein
MKMETRHVKLDYVNALSAKKDLLGAEINLLQIVRKIKAYRMIRKKEMVTKNKLRLEIGKLRKLMDGLVSHLPTENVKMDKRKNKKKKVDEEGRNLDNELREIKKKLERLGEK